MRIIKKTLGHFIAKSTMLAIPPVLLFAFTLYYIFSVRPHLVGDLGQLGKISFDENYYSEIRKNRLSNDLLLNIRPNDSIARVATIGDSFSQMGHIGYVAYLAEGLNEHVTNIPYPSKLHNSLQGCWGMLQSGLFDKPGKPKVVIVECAERFLLDCAEAFDPKMAPLEPPVLYVESNPQAVSNHDWRNYLTQMSKQSSDWLKINLRLEKNPVKHARLHTAAFTVPDKKADLYFMMENKRSLSLIPDELNKVKDVVELLHEEFAKRGIYMIFLIAADKYGLHQDQIADNPYPRRETGWQYSSMDTLGYVINTYPVLKPFVDRGIKDINMADDSHWSYKASRIVADTLVSRISG